MNRQDKNGINWCDYTLNIIVGCNRNCDYCYARYIREKIYGDDKVRFFPERLKEIKKLKKPSRIFLNSMGDIYDRDVKDEWRKQIWESIRYYTQHKFMILTKEYYNMFNDKSILSLKNLIAGITITGNKDDEINELGLDMNFCDWQEIPRRFVSFEPLLNDVEYYLHYINGCEFIIIGSQTKPDMQMKKEWISKIEDYAKKQNLTIIRKHNFLVEQNK